MKTGSCNDDADVSSNFHFLLKNNIINKNAFQGDMYRPLVDQREGRFAMHFLSIGTFLTFITVL